MVEGYRERVADSRRESIPIKVKDIERQFKAIIEEGLEQSQNRGGGGRDS